MRTYGVDLAAEPGDTGHCVIRWESKHAVVEALSVGVGDADIVAGVRAAGSRRGVLASARRSRHGACAVTHQRHRDA